MKNKASVVLAAVFATLIVCGFSAEAATKNGLNSFNFGNSQAGAKGSYSIITQNSTGVSSIQLTATGNVMLLNKTVKGVEFKTTARNSYGTKTSIYSLAIAGYTVDSGTKSISYTWNKPVNRTLLQASATITVGPVPVTVSGSVGGGANIGYTVALSDKGVGLSGNASAWANGSASAGIGVSLLNVSLRSDLQLAKTSFKPSLEVTPTTFSGKADLVFDPVNINLSIALQSMGRIWYQYNLASFSQPSKTTTLLQL
jgi:hypothetical protein